MMNYEGYEAWTLSILCTTNISPHLLLSLDLFVESLTMLTF